MGLFGPSLNELVDKEFELRKKNQVKLSSTNYEEKSTINKPNTTKNFLVLVLIIIIPSVLIFFIWFNPFTANKGISLKEFSAIENGMTYTEVVNIIGEEGTLLSDMDLNIGDEYATSMYVWYGSNSIANANIMFQGGKVIMKSQFGLD